MSKFIIILVIGILAILILLPSMALAQPDVCIFYGTVTLDGRSVEDGTKITAWIDGEKVISTTTYTNTDGQRPVLSSYVLTIDGTGNSYNKKTFAFTIGDHFQPAAEVAVFKNGGNIALDLTSHCQDCHEPGFLEIELRPSEGVATNICGEVSPPNLPVTIYFDEEPYSTVNTDRKGKFCTQIIPPISDPGEYTVTVINVWDKELSETFTIRTPVLDGSVIRGKQGPRGEPGEPGEPGEDGKDGKSTVTLVGLITAIGAAVLILVMGYPSKQNPPS
ncbi:MAG: hypothetical protein HQ553_00270 [Chloroflexi bacterium]|nr:hypothetical protein [Chloroflexota bacterium]